MLSSFSTDIGYQFARRVQRNATAASGSTFGGSTFNGFALRSVETDTNTKGALGLNLLYDPPSPVVDFVFVHGLGGGSRKTWSKSDSLDHFWPGEWLPHDPGFQNVRIHSFGYNSDWASTQDDVSNIQDFALGLLNAVKYAQGLRASSIVYCPFHLPVANANTDLCRRYRLYSSHILWVDWYVSTAARHERAILLMTFLLSGGQEGRCMSINCMFAQSSLAFDRHIF